MKNKYKAYLTSLSSDITTNPKRFWSWLKNKRVLKFNSSNITNDANEVAETPQAKACMFNNYFVSNFSDFRDAEPAVNQCLPEVNADALNNISIQQEEVDQILKSLDVRSAATEGRGK